MELFSFNGLQESLSLKQTENGLHVLFTVIAVGDFYVVLLFLDSDLNCIGFIGSKSEPSHLIHGIKIYWIISMSKGYCLW